MLWYYLHLTLSHDRQPQRKCKLSYTFLLQEEQEEQGQVLQEEQEQESQEQEQEQENYCDDEGCEDEVEERSTAAVFMILGSRTSAGRTVPFLEENANVNVDAQVDKQEDKNHEQVPRAA